MFWHFFGLATVLATLSKIWVNFPPNLLVALGGSDIYSYLSSFNLEFGFPQKS
jgi:hypothetical protein